MIWVIVGIVVYILVFLFAWALGKSAAIGDAMNAESWRKEKYNGR